MPSQSEMEIIMTGVVILLESGTRILNRGGFLDLSACGPRGFAHEHIPPLLMPKDTMKIEMIWMQLCRGVLTRSTAPPSPKTF